MRRFIYQPPPGVPSVIAQDSDFLAVDKPSGLLSNPGRAPETQDCALSRLTDVYGPLWLVHRLDCDTSGILLLARNKSAESALKKQLQARTITKVYEALVTGIPHQDSGSIDQPLGPIPDDPPFQQVRADGKPAHTRYQLMGFEAGNARIALYPGTGRTHQLRVHMAWLGHPLLGDDFYGDSESAPRLCLHARELTFAHPGDGKTIHLHCPCPF